MKVYLDTNVLVSAFTARGLCADLFRYLLVTGDKGLLTIAARAPLPILTPREAWQRLRLAE